MGAVDWFPSPSSTDSNTLDTAPGLQAVGFFFTENTLKQNKLITFNGPFTSNKRKSNIASTGTGNFYDTRFTLNDGKHQRKNSGSLGVNTPKGPDQIWQNHLFVQDLYSLNILL